MRQVRSLESKYVFYEATLLGYDRAADAAGRPGLWRVRYGIGGAADAHGCGEDEEVEEGVDPRRMRKLASHRFAPRRAWQRGILKVRAPARSLAQLLRTAPLPPA